MAIGALLSAETVDIGRQTGQLYAGMGPFVVGVKLRASALCHESMPLVKIYCVNSIGLKNVCDFLNIR